MVSSWVKSLGLSFKRDELLQLDIAEAPRMVFVRPTCYLPENSFKTLRRAMNMYSLTPKELVFVYPDETVKVRSASTIISVYLVAGKWLTQENSQPQTGMWKEVSAGGGPEYVDAVFSHCATSC